MDWFLILVSCISVVILFVVSLYFLVYYQHPDDKNEAWLPKITVLLGMMLAGATVLLLPLDVANNEGYPGCDGWDTKVCGGIPMDLIWDIFYWTIPCFVFLLIPFMTFYYEADDGMLMAGTSIGAQPNSKLCEAMKYQTAVVVIVGAIFTTCYLLLSDSSVPIRAYEVRDIVNDSWTGTTNDGNFTLAALGNITDTDMSNMLKTRSGNEDLIIPVSIPTFFAGFMAFIGWFFFAIFGGIGLASLPLDLVLAFVNRPQHMSPTEFADAQMMIRNKVNELVDQGELLKIERDEKNNLDPDAKRGPFSRFSKAGREERNKLLEFKKAVYLLEENVDDFNACSSNYANYNPLIPWLYLFLGIFAVIFTLIWLIQIILFVLPPNPIHPFVNSYLEWFDGVFPMVGILSIALLGLYLMLCAVHGCFKFGLRFLFITLHPMKVNKTYMSSFLFNIGLILLCALPVVQFCLTTFSDYARYTTVSNVMGTQVQYLQFFSWFWESSIFIYIFISVFGLTTLYLLCKPKDTSESSIGLRDRILGRIKKR